MRPIAAGMSRVQHTAVVVLAIVIGAFGNLSCDEDEPTLTPCTGVVDECREGDSCMYIFGLESKYCVRWCEPLCESGYTCMWASPCGDLCGGEWTCAECDGPVTGGCVPDGMVDP